MSLFHFHVTQIKRSAGQSAVACAAYRAGEKLKSEYYGEVSDYTRKGGVVESGIMLPDYAPQHLSDRETLWNEVEKIEKGKKAQLAYSFDFALQNEFTMEENISLAKKFIREQFVERGMIADFAIHSPETNGIANPHVHVMCPIRPIEENGEWGNKQKRVYELDRNGNRVTDHNGNYIFSAVPTTDWGKPETLEHWRSEWARMCNEKFEEKQLTDRIDYRSYERQGIDKIPTVHEGVAVRQMESKGIKTDKGDKNRLIKSTNALLSEIKEKIKNLINWIEEVKAELEKFNQPETTLVDILNTYAEFNDFEIVGEYEDAGKSGKSIEGRIEFSRMMDDIKSGKDGVSYVLVFKLSRFGRNAADVLSTLQVMQDFGVNLICVEDGIDSSKDAGKLMISILSAVAEIERENIRVQTMEGRIQKAREGKWNGGFAPYGYTLEKGELKINEEEAEAIRIIFDKYVNTDMGCTGIAKYLDDHGIEKKRRQNGQNPLFVATLIRRILKNPVYCGKIAYGRRKTEKIHGTRNDYHLVEQDDYLLVDGLHEPIVSEELWNDAQVKLLAMAKKYEKVNNGKENKIHLLTGLLKCPICGAGMYGNKSIKHKADGTKYKDFYYYGCKHRDRTRGHKCDYKKQIHEELLDDTVAEVISKLVNNPKFSALMQKKITMKVDTSAIEQEIANHEKQLRHSYSVKSRLIEEIDSLDPDDKHYIKRKADLDDRLYKMYDKIEDTESLLIAARAKKTAIEAEKLTADNIYKVLIYFDKLYAVMDEFERRKFMESLVSEVHVYEERKPNGQWLKSIKFKLPIIEEDMELCLDNETHVECAVKLCKG